MNTKNNSNEIFSILKQAYTNNSCVYLFGNGGSASTASHFVCDLIKGCDIKAICLADNIPTVLAYANDVEYSQIFIRQLDVFLEEEDVVIGISGSGNSPNVIEAIRFANKITPYTVSFTGFDGGELKKISKYNMNVNSYDMQIVENKHLEYCHSLAKKLWSKQCTE